MNSSFMETYFWVSTQSSCIVKEIKMTLTQKNVVGFIVVLNPV